jgi:membrane-bound lytic murein transglycosylase D
MTDSSKSGFFDNKNVYGLSFLKTSRKKRRAVKALFKKHGFNNAVKWKLDKYSKQKYGFRKQLSQSGRYVETMAGIFEHEGLPQELVFLPLIESGYDPLAYSQSRAAGPWQFMPSTARKLNLKMDWWIDERRDPIKSTNAAARYLKYLFNKFKSWNLALAAYNAGEGRVRKALKKVRKKDYWTIQKTGHIAPETRNYVPSYIAATAIALNPGNFGFDRIDYKGPLKYDEVVIEYPMDLSVAAKFAGADPWYIKELNPELRRWSTPPNVSYYTLRIPKGTRKLFLKNLARTKGHEKHYINFYTVRPGDTVRKIAQKLGLPMQAILKLNSLGKKGIIMAGKKILVPIRKNLDKLLKTTL